MIDFHPVDISIIIVYFAVTIGVGLTAGKRQAQTADDYILIGRRFVATLVSTWYGGILGVGEFTYRFGIVNWITQGLFFYVIAALFALVFAKRIRSINIYTVPDRLEQVYGKRVALIGSVFTFLMVSPAPYILILGILIRFAFGWNLGICLVIGASISTLYLLTGGFKAVVRTDFLQFILMFAGFFILVPAAVVRYGGIGFLRTHLPDTHLTITGELGTGYILVWGFIALWTLIDPGFYQRCLAAKSGSTAQRGIFTAIAFWMLFDLLTCAAGLYARAALPGIDPLMAYPLLAENLLPAVLKGIFFTGMLATVMSTVDSFTFLSAITIGNDFIGRIRGINKTAGNIKRYTQIGLVISAVFAVIIAWWSRSVIDIWYTLGTIGIPALLIPVIVSYFPAVTISPAAASVMIVSSSAVSTGWLLDGYMHTQNGHPDYSLGIEPMYSGLAVSLLLFSIQIVWNRLK
ncbi:sodium:solute symporter [candidate division KSB1 bacterium]